MKISEFIVTLEAIQKEHGDIDVICVTPGCGPDWETQPPTPDMHMVCSTTPSDRKDDGISTEKYLIIGVNG